MDDEIREFEITTRPIREHDYCNGCTRMAIIVIGMHTGETRFCYSCWGRYKHAGNGELMETDGS